MAKKYGSITVVAYAQTRDGGLLDVDTLSERQKRRLVTELSCRLLNEAYAGQGVKVSPASRKETGAEWQPCATGNG